MNTTDKLIDELSSGLTASSKAGRPLVLFAKWLAGSLAWLAFMLLFYHIRPDIGAKLARPLFVYELIALAALVVSVAIAATYISFPDMLQKRWVVYLPVLPLIAFIYIVYLEFAYSVPAEPGKEASYLCLICISMISSAPAAIMFVMMRRQATTHIYMAGALAMVASTALGNLAFRFVEANDDMTHIVNWHFIPVVGFSFIGVLLGRKFLKW
jgi:hypothetical protein